MPSKEPDDSRIVSVRLPDTLVQRLDRLLDWRATHQRSKSTRNAALREALSVWLDQQEQLAALCEPQTRWRQFQATYHRLCQHDDGVPIYRLRQHLQWPQERFDTVVEALRAAQHIALSVLQDHERHAHTTHDHYYVPGQCYGRLRWRA